MVETIILLAMSLWVCIFQWLGKKLLVLIVADTVLDSMLWAFNLHALLVQSIILYGFCFIVVYSLFMYFLMAFIQFRLLNLMGLRWLHPLLCLAQRFRFSRAIWDAVWDVYYSCVVSDPVICSEIGTWIQAWSKHRRSRNGVITELKLINSSKSKLWFLGLLFLSWIACHIPFFLLLFPLSMLQFIL